MTIVRRPSPFGELMSLRSAMDRLFEDSFVRRPLAGLDGGLQLPLDVTRTADALVVEAALPGISPDDVEITVEDGTLAIRGEYREERNEGEAETLVAEIRRGSVSRAVSLPTGLEPDKATATFENGVLTLRIPKAESVKPRRIQISPTVDGTSSEPVEEIGARTGHRAGSQPGSTNGTDGSSRAGLGSGSPSTPVGAGSGSQG
jgi:HSP20 family protein